MNWPARKRRTRTGKEVGTKVRAVILSTIVVLSVVSGAVVLVAPAAAGTAGNVSLSINSAGDQAAVAVDDPDLNTNSGAVETLLVNVNSTSENATSRADGTSSDTEGGTQDVTISPGQLVYDRTQDGSITAADFTLLGASDEVISSVSPNSLSAGSYTVTVSDSGGSVDGNLETVSYMKLTYQSLSSDTDTSQQVTTNSPVGDRNRDGVIDKTDIAFVSSAPSESITNFNRNADGTATFDIVDSSDTDSRGESFTYLSTETVALAETGADTGIFTGSISLVQSDANGDLLAVEGDDINLTYYDQSPSAARVATQTLDATSPSISSVSLSENSGDQRISFESDEQLGSSTTDVAVLVSGPNGATYTYARGDFSESTSGGSYVYTLNSGSAQPYDDGDGNYGVSIDDAKDAAGNNGGNNGDGSGLTDTYSYSSGGGDTTSPSISSVSLDGNSGDQSVSFTSDEQLGGSSDDLAVTVSGPNGATYSYARGDFSESSIGGGSYAYVLKSGSAQPYDDGDGTYGMSIDDAKDAAGNNGGNNGDGSGLTDTYSYSSGGGDTTAPSISTVSLSGTSGNMDISFASDEQLGTNSGDVAVTVVGPNGKTYAFDRADFSEKSLSGGSYAYVLSTTQAYDDGGGSYTMSVDDAKDSAGNNGGNNGAGSGLTDTHVYSSSSGTDTWINGTVTNASGSVSGATVVAVPQSGGSETIVTTGANGDYSLEIQPSTTYDVIVDDEPDHKFEVETGISVSKSNTKTVDFTVKAFPEKGFINGTVLDTDGNAVSSGYSVEARELGYRFGGTATTDANGEFSVSVPASNYIVRAKGSNGPPKTLDNVTVREGETTDVTIRLPEAGYITGTVENAAGKKVGGVGVVADDGDQIVFDRTNTTRQADTGTYNITAPPGNYTVSVFAKGKSTTSKQVTVTGGGESTANFTLRATSVKHASVEVIEGSGVDTANLGISASVRAGMLQVKVTNQSSSGGGAGPPDELEGLGVTRDTKLRMNVTVTNFTANSLMWGVGDARWSTAENASITNGTDITVTGTPVQLQVMFGGKGGGAETGVGPLMFKDPSQVSWPTGRKDQATAGRNVTVYFGVFDLGNVPGSVRNNLKGMSVTTNAQRFSTPSVVNQSLRVWVAAPTKTVAGNDHNGFYQAEIPDSQLSEWGVDDPESELNALYKGDATNFTVTETDSGARIRLDNISYSAGFAEIEANPSDSTSSTTTTAPERTVGTVTESSSGTASVTVDNVELDDPLVVPLGSVGTDAMTVEEVTATFDMGTNVDNEMRVRATDAPPATVPPIAGDVRSYLTVEVEGNLADRVSRGSFTFSLDADVASNDPGAVTAYRYHDGEWQRVTTRHLGGTRFEVVSPGYSTFAVVVAERQSTPDRTATPTPEPVTTAEPPTTSEPVSTTEPSTTSGSEPAATTAAEPTPTSGPATAAPTTADRETTPTAGAGSPGFGVVAVLAAVLALLALGRRN